MAILERLKHERRARRIGDDDRVVFFAPDEPVGLHSSFGLGADDRTFMSIAAANFRGMNPGVV